ncbi:hypothetical protein [Pseudoalteromonas phenolica]|uniref:hypothetical protein n=1 Tax=Pseudoalteromonas phenolica TaxID=161398 RepID=UPI00384B065A
MKNNDESRINPLVFGLIIGIAIGSGIGVALGSLSLGVIFGIPIAFALLLTQKEDINRDK